jgi:hypothetical protein
MRVRVIVICSIDRNIALRTGSDHYAAGQSDGRATRSVFVRQSRTPHIDRERRYRREMPAFLFFRTA